MKPPRFDPSARFIKNPESSQPPIPPSPPPHLRGPPPQPRPGHPYRTQPFSPLQYQQTSSSSSEYHHASRSSSSGSHRGLLSPLHHQFSSEMRPMPPHFPFPVDYRPYAPFTMAPPYIYPPELLSPAPPAAPGRYLMRPKDRPWSTGIIDCFSDMKTCVITLICPCLTFGQVSEIINEGKTNRWEYATLFIMPIFCSGCQGILCNQEDIIYDVLQQHILHGFIRVSPFLLTMPSKLFFIISLLGVCMYRTKMRDKYKLKGHWFLDLMCTFFCLHLILCQQYRQLDRFGYDVSLGWHANKDKHKKIMKKLAQIVPPEVPPGMSR